MCWPASACTRDFVCLCRWPLGMPWGIKQDFPSQGVLGRMVGWWLQSFLKLSTPSLMWDLTWDWTSAWQICPDQCETSECLTMVSIERFIFFFVFLFFFFVLASLLLFRLFYFCLCGEKRKDKRWRLHFANHKDLYCCSLSLFLT